MTERDDRHVRLEIVNAVGEFIDDFDIDAIVADYIGRYGLVSIDDIPEGEFWKMVYAHDVSDEGFQPS